MKSWLEKNAMKIYSTHNKGTSVVARNICYKYMTSISKNMYIDKLDHIVNKYNNAYHRTIKVKPVDVKPSTHSDSIKEINDEDPKFKIDDITRISNVQNTMFQIGLKKLL